MQARILLLAALLGSCACPASAQPFVPPAGFDCNKAAQPIELTICADARMRWLDGSLAQAYRDAMAAAADAGARETLRAQQRRWIAERDRLYGPRKLFGPDVPPEAQLFEDYMRQGYANRISELRDLAHGPIWSRGPVRLLADDALLAARGDLDIFRADGIYAGVLMGADGRAVPRTQFSPDGRSLAVVIQGHDPDVHDQAWWYRIDDERLLPATPPPVVDGGRTATTIQSLAWDGARTLLVRVTGSNGQPARVFATTGDGSRELPDPPARVRALLDAAQAGAVPVSAPVSTPARCDDCDLLAVRVGDAHAPWLENRSGTVSLKAEATDVDAPPRLLAWGSWEVLNMLYDPRSRQVVFADETGIVHGDLAGNVLRRIAASRPGDVPLAFDPAHGLLAWRTRGGCDVDQSDPDRPRWTQLCIAQFSFAPAAVAD